MAALALLVSLLVLPAPSAEAQDADEVYVNVRSASVQRCGDILSGADLQVVGFHDGERVFQTSSTGDDAPFFGTLHRVPNLSSGETVEVKLGERDALVDDQVCDINPGNGTTGKLDWTGETRRVELEGEHPRDPVLRVAIGTNPPEVPQLNATHVSTTSAVLDWTPAGDAYETVRLREGYEVVHSANGTSSGSARVDGLTENAHHRFRLRVGEGPWTLGSNRVEVKTENAPPPQPEIVDLWRGDDTVTLMLPAERPHDLERVTVFAGEEINPLVGPPNERWNETVVPFPPDTFMTYGFRSEIRNVALEPGDTDAAVRFTDNEGAETMSSPTQIPDEPSRLEAPVVREATWIEGEGYHLEWSWHPPPGEWRVRVQTTPDANGTGRVSEGADFVATRDRLPETTTGGTVRRGAESLRLVIEEEAGNRRLESDFVPFEGAPEPHQTQGSPGPAPVAWIALTVALAAGTAARSRGSARR